MKANLTSTRMFPGKNIRKHEIIAEIYTACRGIIRRTAGYFYAAFILKEKINDENQTSGTCGSSLRIH